MSNIYVGKVVRVLPGMQAAFVDIGLERAAFIHAAEISSREGSAIECISLLVREGQQVEAGQELAHEECKLLLHAVPKFIIE